MIPHTGGLREDGRSTNMLLHGVTRHNRWRPASPPGILPTGSSPLARDPTRSPSRGSVPVKTALKILVALVLLLILLALLASGGLTWA
jgi:hypothetical protein